jgi:hypothetical protein
MEHLLPEPPAASRYPTDPERIRVTILTRHLALRGWLHLPKTAKTDRRLTELLNGNKRFLAMTDVEIIDRESGRISAFLMRSDWQQTLSPTGNERRKAPRGENSLHHFLQINVESIELIIPQT